MREIKFRGWSKEDRKMHYYNKWFTLCHSKTLCFDEEIEDIWYVDGSYVNYPDRVVLMQYTGLKDKNGKDVFEGDIVKCSRGCVHEVVWEKAKPFGDMGGWNLSGLTGKYDWIESHSEVIGNIYENPNLLSENK